MQRYRYTDLMHFSARLLARAGLARERAETVGLLFLEADLLGYSTHGMQCLPTNVEWLLSGETRREGDHAVLSASRSSEVWDAEFLPGPWITARAVDRACDIAKAEGTGIVVIRRAQHIACLASYLERATRRGIMVMITARTPTEAVVVPHGGLSRVFSCNPIAAGIPTDRDPILIDTTAAMSALGPLNRSYRLGQTLPAPPHRRAGRQGHGRSGRIRRTGRRHPAYRWHGAGLQGLQSRPPHRSALRRIGWLRPRLADRRQRGEWRLRAGHRPRTFRWPRDL